MIEPDNSEIPAFMLPLKPRGAPARLRELVISSVTKELASSKEQSLWFTRSEKRRFQFAGLLLLVSVVICFAVEKREQMRMSRLHLNKAMPNQLRELYALIADRDDPNLFAWLSSYCDMAKPRPSNHYFGNDYPRQVIELDPELNEYVRLNHGVF